MKIDDEFVLEVNHRILTMLSRHGVLEQTVGLCGYCGGPVLAAAGDRGDKAKPEDWWGPRSRCVRCGAKPEPMKMQERRQETKPAPERRIK